MSDLKAVPRTDKIQLAPMIEEVLADLSPLAEKKRRGTSPRAARICGLPGSDVLGISSDLQPGGERREIQLPRRNRMRRRVPTGAESGD